MKLVFNSLNSGLANNGGSRTVILCAQALEDLGHKCDIIATSDRFTWFDHKHVIPNISTDLDAILATACTTVPTTLSSNVPIKAWYIRGHESWMYNEGQLSELYNSGVINIVNSKGLQQKLASYGANSVVIYPGVDDFWEDRGLRSEDKVRIGCLYQKKSTKRWGDFVKLSDILGHGDYQYVGVGDSRREDGFLDAYFTNVSIDDLNYIYSSCDIWFAPTELEGLHNVPIEAAMCGCLIVCNDDPMNGMCIDYAFDNNTAMIYHRRDIEQAAELIRNPNWDVVDRMYNHLVNNMGTREDNMKKLVDYLESL